MSPARLARDPLFIVGCEKSGTTLVRSLFDGHADVVTLPVELQLFRVTDVPTAFLAKRRGLAAGEDVATVVQHLLRRSALRRLLGPQPAGDVRALEPPAARRFEREVRGTRGVTDLSDLLVHVHRAYLAATGRDPDLAQRGLIVEKTPLQEEHALRLRRWFPAARFLHVVRNPYATLHALRLRTGQRKLLDLRPQVEALQLSHVFGALNAEEIHNYRFVRYEDVVDDPEDTMRSLADFAGIDFDEVLLAPTGGGRPWPGNSMADTPFCGIDRRPLDRWREHVSDYEVALVNQRLTWVLGRFGYETQQPRSRLSPYRRLRGEDPLAWVLNRWALHEYRAGPHGPPRYRSRP